MRFILFCWIVMMPFSSMAQYSYYRSKIECTQASKEEISKGYYHLQMVMDTMNRENKLFGFYPEKNEKGASTFLAFEVLAEDDKKFKSIIAEWIKRSNVKAMESFWKGCPKRQDTLANRSKLFFPAIKYQGSPVAEVPLIEEKPDPTSDYKIVIDFTAFTKVGDTQKLDSSSVSWGLGEVGRIYNLHVAAGIPKEKIHIVLAVHASATKLFFTDEEYQKRYKRNNPNLPVIKQLAAAGVKMQQCAQSAMWMGFKREMLVPELKMAMSAKTIITSHQMKGYALMNVKND